MKLRYIKIIKLNYLKNVIIFQIRINKILIFFLLINLIFLFINIYFIFSNKSNEQLLNEINYKYLKIFKNIDLFGINMIMKPFSNISFYLNSKFKLNNNKSFQKENKEKKIKKKTLRLYTVGSSNEYYEKLYRNKLIEELQDNFNLEFTSDNPDYLIYDIFNCDFLDQKYKNAVKIAFFTEN